MSDDVTKARTLRSQMYHAGSMVLCPPILGSLDFDADLVSMDLQYPKYRLGCKSYSPGINTVPTSIGSRLASRDRLFIQSRHSGSSAPKQNFRDVGTAVRSYSPYPLHCRYHSYVDFKCFGGLNCQLLLFLCGIFDLL